MKRFLIALALVLAAVLCGMAQQCRADGFIIIHQPPPNVVVGHFAFAPLEVAYHRVSVEVTDQVAVTTVDQEFYNPNGVVLEGTYVFPLEFGSHIDKFSMDVNGKMTDAELLSADKARAMYEEIVRKFRDPALLEYMGRDAFKARIFPIPANGRKHIKLAYTQLLKSDGGLVEYSYPLNTEKFSSRPLGDVSVKVSLASGEPLKSIYSPSHSVDIHRVGDRKATIGWEAKNVRPDTDFKLIFSRSKQPVGVDLMTYRKSADEDGYFMLLASPGIEAAKGTVTNKDICFVLDTSGSMAGAKMEQAKKALSFCLNNLDEGDRFEVIRFSTESEPLFSQLKPANKQNVETALSFVKGMRAIGGTAIGEALQNALGVSHDAARPYVIVFLTDGEPTVGETNEDALVAQASRQSKGTTRIFCFGIGNDVNTHLLDRIAADTRAASAYVAPEEDIEVKVGNFYTKIREPAVTDVHLAFTGDSIRTSELYPNVMPDLFKGEVLVAFGRYKGKGPAAIEIRGSIGGEKHTFVTDVKFADKDTTNSFIPRLWATRRVGYLLDQIRMHGESKEIKDEVTRLAREHGIVTPYTAYLILEDEKGRNVPTALQNFREFGGDARVRDQAAGRFQQTAQEAASPAARTGAAAVDAAKDVDSLRRGENLEQNRQMAEGQLKKGNAMPSGGQGVGGLEGKEAWGYRTAQNYAQQARVLNGRAFYQNGSVWTDGTAQSRQNLKEKKIAFNSDEYFALLQKHPEAAEWLSLGSEVDLVLDDTLYVVR